MRLPFIALLAACCAFAGRPAAAQPAAADRVITEAREALDIKDRRQRQQRLSALRESSAGHPLAQWVEYWELTQRLAEAQQPELNAFYQRWSGTYVEDRLRNDWLLELGRRRDWDNFSRDVVAFRMNDDRQVHCYRLLTQHLAGQDVREAARTAWLTQRDADDGCSLLARTLFQAGQLKAEDVWLEARLSADANRPRAVREALALVSEALPGQVSDIFDRPQLVLRRADGDLVSGPPGEIALLAFMRLAASDSDAAAALLAGPWARRLPAELAAFAWATTGKYAAMRQQPEAAAHYTRAFTLIGPRTPNWGDDILAWGVRAQLRAAPAPGSQRWQLVLRTIEAMSPAEQRDAAWVYWKARALQGRAKAGEPGEPDRQAARELLESLSGQLNFYGVLALEDLGRRFVPPPAPAALTDTERAAPRGNPGLARALQLIALGLRNEGVREWNWTLRGMSDRELLAAAALGCERQVWDRCINTSDRTRSEVDMAQRYPLPLREHVLPKAEQVGVDPAYVYGLIRQESRFIMDVRSHVGASGLMQLMPATARWTAARIGLPYKPSMITDRDTNLMLGKTYLKLVLDDFEGSQALAAAAYNAGPSRPRRWREGAVLEAAAWAESIPFNETRDYVKKVLSNAVFYAAVLNQPNPPSLKQRLGGPIGPRDGAAPAPNRNLP